MLFCIWPLKDRGVAQVSARPLWCRRLLNQGFHIREEEFVLVRSAERKHALIFGEGGKHLQLSHKPQDVNVVDTNQSEDVLRRLGFDEGFLLEQKCPAILFPCLLDEIGYVPGFRRDGRERNCLEPSMLVHSLFERMTFHFRQIVTGATREPNNQRHSLTFFLD